MSKKTDTFEEKLARLEEIVNKLDSDTITLEESSKLFEEGIALSKELSEKLSEVKFKVDALKQKGKELVLEPFDKTETDENA